MFLIYIRLLYLILVPLFSKSELNKSIIELRTNNFEKSYLISLLKDKKYSIKLCQSLRGIV